MCRKLHLDIGAEMLQNRMALLDNCLVECDAVQSGRIVPTVLRNFCLTIHVSRYLWGWMKVGVVLFCFLSKRFLWQNIKPK
jgi:hypothetical protein